MPVIGRAEQRRLLGEILKSVSRSFYLSMAILPRPVRQPIAIAYLLARAADSVADCAGLEARERREALDRLRSWLRAMPDAARTDLLAITVLPAIDHPGERHLLHRLEPLYALHHAQAPEDRARVTEVVETLTEGMGFDLEYFEGGSAGAPVALETMEQLDRYTYLVAGCVGGFWTRTLHAHLPAVRGWEVETMVARGECLGRALQYTNILRDLPRDLRLGRCYLPRELLAHHGLVPADLLDAAATGRARGALAELVAVAAGHYRAGLDYLLATPRSAPRLRLATLWPMAIGIETLAQLVEARRWLDPDHVVKVERAWVWAMVRRSLPRVASDRALERWIGGALARLEARIGPPPAC